MHPDDEDDFISEVLHDDEIVLIDGPRWKSSSPECHRSLESIGPYCIIWSKKDLATLDSEFIPKCNDWHCRSEGATIQFLRSRTKGSVMTVGRLAIGTSSERNDVVRAVEKRFQNLCAFAKKRYVNGILQWRNPNFVEVPAAEGRSSNPSKADNALWIGPAAVGWLQKEPTSRKVKLDFDAPVEAVMTGRMEAGCRR